MSTCPRRVTEFGPWPKDPGLDRWETRMTGAPRTCSFCGSMHPDDAMELIEAGAEVTPTDSEFEAYVEVPLQHRGNPILGKLMFKHFSLGHQDRLIAAMNADEVNFAHPGHFEVPPFFMTPRPKKH